MANLGVLDPFDRQILNLVQHNNQLTHSAIGERIGLSASAVRRRLRQLRDSGIIERDVSVLNSAGIGVRLIVKISFQNEGIDIFEDFDRQMRGLPEVLQSYHISGPVDYIVIVQGPSVEWYEDWGKQVFMSNPNIRRYDTHVVWSCKKFETAVAL